MLCRILLFFGVGESNQKSDGVTDDLRLVAQARQVGDDLVEEEGDRPRGAGRVLTEGGDEREAETILKASWAPRIDFNGEPSAPGPRYKARPFLL